MSRYAAAHILHTSWSRTWFSQTVSGTCTTSSTWACVVSKLPKSTVSLVRIRTRTPYSRMPEARQPLRLDARKSSTRGALGGTSCQPAGPRLICFPTPLSTLLSQSGTLAKEIVPVEIKGRKGTTVVSEDEEFRNVNPDRVPSLRSVFLSAVSQPFRALLFSS